VYYHTGKGQISEKDPVVEDLAEMTYTLDGSNPKDGLLYEGPFDIGPEAVRLLVYARAGEATKTADFQIPASGDKTVHIDEAKPARLNSSKRVALDTTDRVFGVINHFKDQPTTRFKGVRIEIGEGENTVTVRFQEREITAAMIEGVVNSLRSVLQEDDAAVAITITDGVQFENGFEAKEFTSARRGKSEKPPVKNKATLGFGVPATSDPHHFRVSIPRSNTG